MRGLWMALLLLFLIFAVVVVVDVWSSDDHPAYYTIRVNDGTVYEHCFLIDEIRLFRSYISFYTADGSICRVYGSFVLEKEESNAEPRK